MSAICRLRFHQDFMAMTAGDRLACEAVVLQAAPLVAALARRSLRREQDTQDLVQEVLLKLIVRMAEFDERKGDALAWLLGIAKYEIMTHRKRMVRLRETRGMPVDDAIASADISPEAGAMARQIGAAADELIAGLRDVDVNVLLKDALEEEDTGPKTPGARKRLQRARERFARAWFARFGQESPFGLELPGVKL